MRFHPKPFRARHAALLALLLLLQICPRGALAFAQGATEPRRETLLNGLNVLLWERPGSPDVLVKLRIHSGAAFDLAGKAGTMALLGDAFYLDQTARDYITNELGGKVEVKTDYDAIEITLSARAQDYERLLDSLRTAVINVSLSPATVTQLREARARLLREEGANPVLVADRAIYTRLFGEHPYGRPYQGSTETLQRIERSDLQYARERFLNPNNATLVVAGGVDRARALRALRQLLGGWRKSEGVIPSTFRQPDAPDARTLLIDLPGTESAEVRVAVRGLARSDKDYAAATVLALVARDRWQSLMPELKQTAFFVRHEGHVLPGIFLMGASVQARDAARALATAQQALQDLARTPPPATELERARSEALATFNRQTERPETVAELWLDADTFKLQPVADRARSLAGVTAADVQRVAARLVSNGTTAASFATVVTGSVSLLKPELERVGKVQVLGEADAPPSQPPQPRGQQLLRPPKRTP